MANYVLNRKAFDNARDCIKEGKIDYSEWDFEPSDIPSEKYREFAENWCLGHLKEGNPDTKAYWGYPIGNGNGKVNRKALASAMGYARKNNEDEIYEATQRLTELLYKYNPETQQEAQTQDKPVWRFENEIINLSILDAQGKAIFEEIFENFQRQKELGIKIPITYPEADWKSDHPQTDSQVTRGRVGYVEELVRRGNIIFAQAAILNEDVARKMASGELSQWSIGYTYGTYETLNGTIEGWYLNHITLTANPAFTEQGGFRRLLSSVTYKFLGSPVVNWVQLPEQTKETNKGGDEVEKAEVEELKRQLAALQLRNFELEQEQIKQKTKNIVNVFPDLNEEFETCLTMQAKLRNMAFEHKVNLVAHKGNEEVNLDAVDMWISLLTKIAERVKEKRQNLTADILSIPNTNTNTTDPKILEAIKKSVEKFNKN